MEEKKIRVCECLALVESTYGGMEEFVINMINHFSNPNCEYALYLPVPLKNEKLRNAANAKGIKIFEDNLQNGIGFRGKIQMHKIYKNFFKQHRFDVIHIHGASIVNLTLMTMVAKKYGKTKVIVHSHNTGMDGFRERIELKICKNILYKYADQYLACSDAAAQWMFPDKIIKANHYMVINNGIDVKKFAFNPAIRNEYRQKLGLHGEFVLCNVGRFHFQKNHEFMVEIAAALNKKNFNFKFILVGDGDLKEGIINRIKDLQLSDKFIVLEKRNDIPQIMMASDAFIFPSKFEGLGIVAIEAQASGLPVIASEAVPRNINVTNLVKFLSIGNSQSWADEIVELRTATERQKYADKVAEAGYSAEVSAEQLEEIYVKYWRN